MTLAFQCHTSASQDRLEQLIAERLAPGADKAAIDRRIWDLFGETWAVMYTDLAGFSRGIADFGVTHFLQVIYEAQRLLLPEVRAHDGILLKLEGDSMLVIFRNPSKAVHCATGMQRLLAPYDAAGAAGAYRLRY
jgi:class 3 adenylate cyclase